MKRQLCILASSLILCVGALGAQTPATTPTASANATGAAVPASPTPAPAATVPAAQAAASAPASIPAAFRQEGIASWYGAEFANRPTASGEIFDPAQLTAAHPSLPFGTRLRVTNKQNGKNVVVRVNDRGPFVAARILDVSKAAAEKLDMLMTGTAPVLVEAVSDAAAGPQAPAPAPATVSPQPDPVAAIAPQPVPAPAAAATVAVASPPPAAPKAQDDAAAVLPALPDPANGKRYSLQVGSWREARFAAEAYDRLKAHGFDPRYEDFGEFRRVVLSGVPSAEVLAKAQILGKLDFKEVLAREER